VEESKAQDFESGRSEWCNFALWIRCIPNALKLEKNGLTRRNVCCNKPIPNRPPVKELNSRGKNGFPVRSIMSHDSLAELRNPQFDRQIYSLRLATKQPKTSATNKLTCWGLNCLPPPRPGNFYCPSWSKGSQRGPQGKYMRPSFTWMISVIQLTHIM